MADVSSKVTLGNETYQIVSTGRALSTTILKTSFDKMATRQGCTDTNFLNHWFDSNEVGSEVDISTQLDTDETTIADYKSSVVSPSLVEFKDSMLPVLKSFLKFAYYVELGKQWETPLDPLNLIYVDDFNTNDKAIKGFYHNAQTLPEVSPEFLNSVIKMMIYMFVPEETNQAGSFSDTSAQDYFNQISNDANLIAKFGSEEVNDLEDFVYNLQVREGGESLTSVEDILNNLGADDILQEVQNSEGVVPTTVTPTNLTDFMQPTSVPMPEETAQADEKPEPKMSKKEQQMAEMKKELERKAKEKQARKEAKKKAKQGNTPTPKTQSEPTRDEHSIEDGSSQNPAKKGGKGKWLFGGLAALMLLGGGYYVLHSHSNNNNTTQTSSSSSNSTNPANNPYFKKGSLDAGGQNYKDAAAQFDTFFSNGAKLSDLNNAEIATVFASYLNTNQYQKILDNIGNNQTATALVNYLTAKKNLKAVDKLNSTLPIINLVKADNKHDYNGIVNNVDNSDVKNNGQLQLDICKAFAKTKKLTDGKNWAEQQKDGTKLKKLMGAYAKQNGMSDKTIKSQLGI